MNPGAIINSHQDIANFVRSQTNKNLVSFSYLIATDMFEVVETPGQLIINSTEDDADKINRFIIPLAEADSMKTITIKNTVTTPADVKDLNKIFEVLRTKYGIEQSAVSELASTTKKLVYRVNVPSGFDRVSALKDLGTIKDSSFVYVNKPALGGFSSSVGGLVNSAGTVFIIFKPLAANGSSQLKTEVQETMFAYYILSKDPNTVDFKALEPFVKSVVKLDRLLQVDLSAWKTAFVKVSTMLNSKVRLNTGAYTAHRNSQMVTKINDMFNSLKSQSTVLSASNFNKWNPADLWFATKAGEQAILGLDVKFISDLNSTLETLFNSKDLIPVSLKKNLNPVGIEIRNHATSRLDYSKIAFDKIVIGDNTNSATMFIKQGSNKVEITLRVGNNTNISAEIKLTDARGGKVGEGPLEGMISNLTKKPFKINTIVGTTDESYINYIKASGIKVVNLEWRTSSWLKSKAKAIAVANAILSLSPADKNKISQFLYSYASSQTTDSSVFVVVV